MKKLTSFLVIAFIMMANHNAFAQLTLTQAIRAEDNATRYVISLGGDKSLIKSSDFAGTRGTKDEWNAWAKKFTQEYNMFADSGLKFVREDGTKFIDSEAHKDTLVHVRAMSMEIFVPGDARFKGKYVAMYAFIGNDETPQSLYSFKAPPVEVGVQNAKLKAKEAEKNKKDAGTVAKKATTEKKAAPANASAKGKTKGKSKDASWSDLYGALPDSTKEFLQLVHRLHGEVSMETLVNIYVKGDTALFGLEQLHQDAICVHYKHQDKEIVKSNMMAVYTPSAGTRIYLSGVPDGKNIPLAIKSVVPVKNRELADNTSSTVHTSNEVDVKSGSSGPLIITGGSKSVGADTVGDIFRTSVLKNPGDDFALLDPNDAPSIFNSDPKWGYYFDGETKQITHLGRSLLKRDYRLERLALRLGSGGLSPINNYGLNNSFGYVGDYGYGGGGYGVSAGVNFGYGWGTGAAVNIQNNYYGGCGGCYSAAWHPSVVSFQPNCGDCGYSNYGGAYGGYDGYGNGYTGGYRSTDASASEEEVFQDPTMLADLTSSDMSMDNSFASVDKAGFGINSDSFQQKATETRTSSGMQSMSNRLEGSNSPAGLQDMSGQVATSSSGFASMEHVAPTGSVSASGMKPMGDVRPMADNQSGMKPMGSIPSVESKPSFAQASDRGNGTQSAYRPVSQLPGGVSASTASGNHGNSKPVRPMQQRPMNTASQNHGVRPNSSVRPAQAQQVRPAARPTTVRPQQARPTVSRPNVRPTSARPAQARPAARPVAHQAPAMKAAPGRRR